MCFEVARRAQLAIVLVTLLVGAQFAGLSLAQQLNTQAISPAAPVLKHLTYDSDWLRYDNLDAQGNPKLAIADVTRFDFRFLVSVFPLRLAELEEPAGIATLGQKVDLAYDQSKVAGYCDSKKLSESSSDIICVPGPCSMPEGYVLLALYHPDTKALVAVTTTIDNFEGVASRKSACSAVYASVGSGSVGSSASHSEARIDAQAGQPAVSQVDQPKGCGPYMPGQWIKPDEYAASGLNLAIVMHDLANQVTDYTCVVPDDGTGPYLLAYTVVPPPPPPPPRSAPQAQRAEAQAQTVIDC